MSQLDVAAARARSFHHRPYLLTVGPDLQPHCRPVEVDWDTDAGTVRVSPRPRAWPDGGPRPVSLLWAPDDPGGYSLILDGEATALGTGQVIVRPTRAVLHRPGSGPEPTPGACGSDCVPLYPLPASG